MDYFKKGYGLVTERDQTTENCNLFYAQYILLKGKWDAKDYLFFMDNMARKYIKKGLYNRREGNDTRSVSHDEITGWMVASHLLGTNHKQHIWDYLIKHLGVYDNNGSVYLPFNPANFYNWGAYVESPLHWLFLPLYFINLQIAIHRPKQETSSKIIYWLELFSMPDNWVNRQMKKIFVKKMTDQYGEQWLSGLYEIYFKEENKLTFPLWIELDNKANKRIATRI